MTENIRQINEKQYKDIFLNETMHYPDFLDKLKGDVTTAVSTKLIQLIRSKKQNDTFEIKTECEYVDKITVNVVVSYGRDIKDKKNYALQYFNTDDELSDGKLRNPKLNIHIPSERDATDLATVAYGIAHELTHLYDDWNSIRSGKGCICAYKENIGTTEFIERAVKFNGTLIKDLAFMSYMSLKTERQAFLSQTIQELEKLGCGLGNYKDVVKETSLYKNVIESYKNIILNIEKSTDEQLFDTNYYIISMFPNASIPKIGINDFCAEKYKNKLLKWCEIVKKETMSRFGSVVQHYLDMLDEDMIKHNCIFVR